LDTAAILDLLKRAVDERQVKISLHAMLSAELLEDYPDWWLGPSCLVHGQTDLGRDLHIVVSYSGLPVTIITVYEPHPPKWITPTQRGGS
jgi:hypothetical protein